MSDFSQIKAMYEHYFNHPVRDGFDFGVCSKKLYSLLEELEHHPFPIELKIEVDHSYLMLFASNQKYFITIFCNREGDKFSVGLLKTWEKVEHKKYVDNHLDIINIIHDLMRSDNNYDLFLQLFVGDCP